MRLSLVLLFFFSLNIWGADLKLPPLTSPVMDLAGLMSAPQQKDLADLAYEIYTNNGPQITILTVDDLQDYPIEEYSIRVAEKWQLGSKEKDNGLLVIISKANRQMRIEVGNGIEGEVTDYDTSQYTRKIFPEYFRNGDFHGGLRLFMEDMANRFNIKLSEATTQIVRRAPPKTALGKISSAVLLGIFFFLFIINAVLSKKPALRGIITGGTFSLAGFLFLGGGLILVVLFIIGLAVGLIGLQNLLFALLMNSGGGRGPRGGGFGGGGGGWSGGGGGFSGGGSSGNW